MIEQFFNLIAPHLCMNCRKTGSILCTACLGGLPAPPRRCYRCMRSLKGKRTKYVCAECRRQAPIDALISATSYEVVAKELVHRLKFGRASAAANAIATSIAQRCTDVPSDMIVTYAPTAAKRVRIRGYDQSQLIAKRLAKQLGLPYCRLLRRVGQTRQVGASRQQRKEQIQHAFQPTGNKLTSQRVIVVDDILTTGATLEAAAAALKQAGASHVTAVVFAVA